LMVHPLASGNQAMALNRGDYIDFSSRNRRTPHWRSKQERVKEWAVSGFEEIVKIAQGVAGHRPEREHQKVD
jgi:hypothetical protein